MFLKKINCISLFLIFGLIITSTFIISNISGNVTPLEKNPKLNQSDITINSPIEGKSYRPLVKGYYPATYGFEDEVVGTTGLNIDFIDEYSGFLLCNTKVISELDGHKNILMLDDPYWIINTQFFHYFGDQGSGSIEFWMRTTDATKRSHVRVYSSSNDDIINFKIKDNKFRTNNEDTFVDLLNPVEDNKWYHIRFDFESTIGSYQGLSQYEYYVYIDGVGYGPFGFRYDMIPNKLFVGSNGADGGYSSYYDAFGFSWDPNYEVGDNKPIIGYYPGLYGFENDAHGAYGTSISILDEWTGNMGAFLRMYVRDGPYDGHNKVLMIFDSQGGGLTSGVHNFDNPQSSGTIEFWLRMEGAAEVGSNDRFHEIHFRKSDNTIAFRAQLKMLEGGWVSGDRADVAYYDGSEWEEFADCEDKVWYHHTIMFDCADEGKFTWIIRAEDGTLVGMITDVPFENSMTTLDEIFFTSIQSHYRGATYWDAFGFDWELNYNVGDNRREGLLLDFNPDDLSEMTYKLDTNPTIPILGDTVIPIPENGQHTITVSADGYNDAIVSFKVKSIDINSPLNGEMFQFSEEGYYAATYGFENDQIGEDPEGWVTVDNYVDVEIQVIDELDGHKKVLEIYDQNGYYDGQGVTQNSFFPRTHGTIEFWVRVGQFPSHSTCTISLKDSEDDYIVEFYIEDEKWKYLDNHVDKEILRVNSRTPSIPVPDKWYYIELDFRCNGAPEYKEIPEGKWNVTINGIKGGEMGFNYLGISSIDSFFIGNMGGRMGNIWVDAVGFSWDPCYNLGDNRFEGLLLDVESENFEWLKYSYDNGPLSTLLGDKVIPFGSSSHSIEVIGGYESANYSTTLWSNKVFYDTQEDRRKLWGLSALNVFDTWDQYNMKGRGVNVLVIDTGIYYDHPDLNDNYKEGGPDYYKPDNDPIDENGHGTSCAGIIGAELNGYGSIGAAPNANLYACRIMGPDGQSNPIQDPHYWPQLASAIQWAVETHDDTDPDNDIDIISMSVGGIGPSFGWYDVKDAVYAAEGEGIIMLGAAGNYVPGYTPWAGDLFPNSYYEVWGIGAVEPYGEDFIRAEFSRYMDFSPEGQFLNHDRGLTFVAPGVDIFSLCGESMDGSSSDKDFHIDDYMVGSGTSFSTPMVAGVIALMIESASEDLLWWKENVPWSFGNKVKEILIDTIIQVGGEPYTQFGDYYMHEWYGFGMINALAAVQAASEFYDPNLHL